MAAALTFLQHAGSTTNLTTYTFSSQNLGTAASDRYIVVCVQGRRSSGALSVSSMTVAGVSAALVTGAAAAGAKDCAEIWIAAVPTGTSGDVVVTFSGACVRAAIQMFGIVGADMSAPADAGASASAGTAPTTSLDVPAGGSGVAGMIASYGTSGTSVSWAGLTERSDNAVEVFSITSAAGDDFASQQTGLTVTATPTGTGVIDGVAGAFASWGPAAAPSGGAVKLAGEAFRLAGGGGLAG